MWQFYLHNSLAQPQVLFLTQKTAPRIMSAPAAVLEAFCSAKEPAGT
jgi:hypothetical protein